MDFNIFTVLVQRGLISEEQKQEIEKEVKTRKVDPETAISDRGIVAPEVLAQLKSEVLNIPLKRFSEEEKIPRETLLLIPQQSARHYQMIAFNKDDNFIYVGMVRPENSEAQQALKFIAKGMGLGVKIFVISSSDLNRFLSGYSSFGEEVASALEILRRQAKEAPVKTYARNLLINFDDTRDVAAEDTPIIKMVSEIVKNAINQRASDIHIEPERTRLRVRYRIDGDLSSVLFLPLEVHSAVVTRVKILSSLKIDETRVPQDGRFGALLGGRQIDFRVSTFPTASGEKVAIRILDPSTGLINLEGLGLSQWNLDIIRAALKKPYGMILVTGPTGSGKTTTLYAILQILNQDAVNIVTLEDPIEYFITGINQSQVIPEIGYTFAQGLRSILRQDPDVIMVGEVRDTETAELAVHSALTGHIVLSTLHTNTAVSTIPRLLDLGVQRFLIPATLNIIIAQRLVRKLCPDCKQETEATPEQQELISQALDELPQAIKHQFSFQKPYRLFEPSVGAECKTCKGKGFWGRTGVYEVLQMTPEIEKMVLKGEGESTLLEEAKQRGMVTLRQEAVMHLLRGVIPFSEVIRETY